MRAWLKEKAPDVLFFVYNDHVTSFFFDHYSNFALGFARDVRSRGRGRRSAASARDQGTSGAREAHREWARRGRVRSLVLSVEGSRPRRVLAAVHDVAARARVARSPRAAAGRSAAVSDPDGPALFRARSLAAQSDSELSGGSQGRDRRHRRALPSGQRRARRLQQYRLGHGVSGAPRKGSRKADRAVHCGLCEARRHRGRGSHHVAGHARRADARKCARCISRIACLR